MSWYNCHVCLCNCPSHWWGVTSSLWSPWRVRCSHAHCQPSDSDTLIEFSPSKLLSELAKRRYRRLTIKTIANQDTITCQLIFVSLNRYLTIPVHPSLVSFHNTHNVSFRSLRNYILFYVSICLEATDFFPCFISIFIFGFYLFFLPSVVYNGI